MTNHLPRLHRNEYGYFSADGRVTIQRGGEGCDDTRTWHLIVDGEYWSTWATKRGAWECALRLVYALAGPS